MTDTKQTTITSYTVEITTEGGKTNFQADYGTLRRFRAWLKDEWGQPAFVFKDGAIVKSAILQVKWTESVTVYLDWTDCPS